MKKFNRTPMRPDKEPDVETEIWQPDWHCFCCHDSGIIVPHLAAMIIDGYDPDRDKLPRCVAPGCRSGSQYDSDALRHSVSYQIDDETCQELDAIERDDWKQTVERKFANIQALAAQMKMFGSRDGREPPFGHRTDNDEREIQQRKQEVEAISHEEWLEMSSQYLGGGD
mgnify:CR=1 FL=1